MALSGATSFNVTIANGGSYTVPSGKTAIFAARMASSETAILGTMSINGNIACQFISNGTGDNLELKPFTANAGDVIGFSTGGTAGTVALSGLLY